MPPAGASIEEASTAAQSVAASVTSGFSSPISGGLNTLQIGMANEERLRLCGLVSELTSKRTAGAVIHNVSQEAIIALCGILTEKGFPPLYAMGAFNFETCFRTLVIGTKASQALGAASAGQGTSRSSEKALATGSMPLGIAFPSLSEGGLRGPRISRSESRNSQTSARLSHMTQTTTTDPAAQLSSLKGESGAQRIELFVSLNSVGVVSDYADCVVLSSDLAYLGQALELASRGVPTIAVATLPGEAAAAAGAAAPNAPQPPLAGAAV